MEFMFENFSSDEHVEFERITWCPIRELRRAPACGQLKIDAVRYTNRNLEVDEVVFDLSDIS